MINYINVCYLTFQSQECFTLESDVFSKGLNIKCKENIRIFKAMKTLITITVHVGICWLLLQRFDRLLPRVIFIYNRMRVHIMINDDIRKSYFWLQNVGFWSYRHKINLWNVCVNIFKQIYACALFGVTPQACFV